jgi:hypothetical protein
VASTCNKSYGQWFIVAHVVPLKKIKIDNVKDTGICADSKILKSEVNIWQFKLLRQIYGVFTASEVS